MREVEFCRTKKNIINKTIKVMMRLLIAFCSEIELPTLSPAIQQLASQNDSLHEEVPDRVRRLDLNSRQSVL